MLSKFIYNDCFKKVPHTGSTYELDCKGNLRDTFHKKTVEIFTEDGVPKIAPVTGEWFDGFPINVVLAITHRNSLIPPRLLNKLELIHLKDDASIVSLYRSIWKCPEGKLEHPLYPGFCYVPGYSRYLINREGQLLSPATGTLLSPYEDSNGYLMYGVQPDVGKRTIVGMHRLLCLAWKPYPYNVDKLDVNHIDCNKSNNSLDNLEWATRSRNNFHAHENGLSNSKRIDVRDVATGEVVTYYSISEAARDLGIEAGTLSNRLRESVPGTVFDGHQYKLTDDPTPWVIHDKLEDYRDGKQARSVRIVDVVTGMEQVVSSIGQAAQVINAKRSMLTYRFSRSPRIVVNDYVLELVV